MEHHRPVWPPPPLDDFAALVDAPSGRVINPDRMTRLLQARTEWLIADAIGLPTPLDDAIRRRQRWGRLRALWRGLTRIAPRRHF